MYNYTDEDRHYDPLGGDARDCCPLCCLSIDDPSDYYAYNQYSGEPMYGGICRDCANAMLRDVVSALSSLTPAQLEEISGAIETACPSSFAHTDPESQALTALAEALGGYDADALMVIDAMTDGEYLPDLVESLCKSARRSEAA